MIPSQVKTLLDKHLSLRYDQEKKKVICSLTSHEMKANTEAIQSYVKGKKYRKAAEENAYNYDQHKQHLVPSTKKKHTHELFCKLTLRHIGKSPKDIERHVNGKRYKRALARYEKCKATGEKFVPRVGGRKKQKISDSDSAGGGDWVDDEGSEEEDDEDDLSDLYPAEDFKAQDDDSKEDSVSGDEDDDDDNDENNTSSENEDDETQAQPEKKSAKKQAAIKSNSKPKTVFNKKTQDSDDSDYDPSVLENGDSIQVKQDASGSSKSKPVIDLSHKKKKPKQGKSNKRPKPQQQEVSMDAAPVSKKKKKLSAK